VSTFRWDEQKNRWLKQQRGVGFEDVLIAIDQGNLLDLLEHPNDVKYPDQWLLVVKLGDYAYLVPYELDGEDLLLKTIIPSHKATQRYLGG
jgi:uncharacterized DUF497 family protein